MKTTLQFIISFIIGICIFIGGNYIYNNFNNKTTDLEYKNDIAYDKSGNPYSGEYKRYTNNTSHIEATGNYINGKKNGEYIDFHTNKQINIKSNYTNGKLDGDFYIYNRQGIITEKAIYNDGSRQGKTDFFYDNGKLSGFTNYNNGKLDGESKLYFENGDIKYELNYKDDKKEGKEYFYNTKGKIIQDFDYKDGILVKGTLWDDDGNKTLDLILEEGKNKITEIKYDKQGNIIE